jgi:hypothetical protein
MVSARFSFVAENRLGSGEMIDVDLVHHPSPSGADGLFVHNAVVSGRRKHDTATSLSALLERTAK